MTRQVTDQLYIELDYFTPEEYYTYEAYAECAQTSAFGLTCDVQVLRAPIEASAALTSEFTQSTAVGKLVSATSDLASEFTQTAQGYRTIEIVLSAFSEGTLASSISRLRDYNSSLTDEFDIAIDYVRLLTALGDLSSEFTQVTDSERSRNFESVQSAAFSLAATTTIIPAFIEASASLNSEFTQSTEVARTRYALADLNVEASLTTAIDRLRYGVGDLTAQADLAVTGTRIIDVSATISDAFTATLSANASKNLTAALDTQSSMSVAGTKTGTLESTVSSTASLTATADRFANAQVVIESNVSISAAASRSRSSAVAQSATFSQTTNPEYILLYRDPLRIAYSGTYARISSTQKKFGTYSLKADDVGQTDFAVQKITNPVGGLDIYDFDAGDWTIEFFYWDNEDTSSGEVFERIFALKNSSGTSKLDLFKETTTTGSNNRYQLESIDWTNTAPLDTGGYSISAWRHFAVTYTASTKGLAFYFDGSRVGTKTFGAGWTNMSRFSLGGPGYAISNAYIDELRISDQVRYTGTSFTVPTTEFAKNRKDVALFKFEEEYLVGSVYYSDSETTQQVGQAALSSEFAQSTAAVRTRTAQSSLSSSFTVAAIIGSIEEIATAMFDDVELSATANVIKQTDIAVSSEFTQTTAVNRTRYGLSDVNAEFAQSTDINRIRYVSSTQSSEFTQTTDGDLIAVGQSALSTAFTQTTEAARTRTADSTQSAAFTQSIDNVRVRYADSTQSSQFSLTADVQRVQQVASDLASAFTQTTSIERFRKTPADLASEFAQSTAINRIRYGLADLNAAFTQVTDVIRQQQGSASIAAAFEQTTTASRTRNLDSTQSAVASITVNAAKTVDAVIATEAIATQLTAAAKIGDFLIDCAVTATVSCAGARVRFFETLSEPRGVNLQDDVTGTDLGPFLLLDTYTGGTSLGVSRSLISFWTNQGTTGAILNTDGVYDGNPSGTNILRITKEGSDYFLYYYGNRAEAGIFPYVKWAIDYANQDLLHNFLIYLNPYQLNEDGGPSTYHFYLDGVEQTLIEITDAYVEPKQRHPFTIKDGLMLGYASRFFAIGGGSGYTPYANLENTAPNSAVLAQFWMDNNTPYDITDVNLRNKFYNAGWTDLGTDGTASGLSRPDYYVRLNGYQDLDEQGTVSAVNNNWSWKYFNNRRTASGVLLYDISEFAATPDQDNPYVTQIVASLTATSVGVYLFAANLPSTSTLSATGVRTQANSAALSSSFAVTANITVNIGTITTVQSAFSLGLLGGRLQTAGSAQSSQFAVTAIVGAIGDNNIDMFSAFAVTADVDLIPPIRTEANLSSAFTQAVNAGFREQSAAALGSEFAVTADATEIPPIRIEANLSSNFSVTASIAGTFDNEVNLSSEFTQTTSGGRIRRPSAGLQAQATLSITAGRLVAFQANLPAVATQLTVASAISIDEFYQYKVEAETRRGTVLPENRVFQVESESRVNMIL